MIKLIVGLGNPGLEYENTRHNAGFWVLDNLVIKYKESFKFECKYFSELTKLKIKNNEIYLLKPQTYMNLSGKAVLSLANFYKILPSQVLVIHDELDFKPGVIKLKLGGGSGGHNGLKDIERVIGRDYWRLRVGIGHPNDAKKVSAYVLNKPSMDEKIAIDLAVDKFLSVFEEFTMGDKAIAQKSLHS